MCAGCFEGDTKLVEKAFSAGRKGFSRRFDVCNKIAVKEYLRSRPEKEDHTANKRVLSVRVFDI